MKPISSNDSELIKLLLTQLGFSENAIIKPESTFSDDYPIHFDLIIEDAAKTYIIKLRRAVDLESLSQLVLLKQLLSLKASSSLNIEFVIAGKRITPEAFQAARQIGIKFIKLPADLNLGEGKGQASAISAKLTSSKSWRVISYLLKMKDASIRQVSLESGVSYGWTHATVRALVSKGIVSDASGRLNVVDINKLINGIAWERPFEKLFSQEMRIASDNAVVLAKEISLVCDEQRIPCAFTSFTAGEIYTGYSARHDSVYLYLEQERIDELAGLFEIPTKGGIAVRIYIPDRDIFKDRRTASLEGVWLVSPAQALLDCAGLGYAGRDITQKLVEAYDRL